MLTPLDVPLIQFGRQVRRPRWFPTCSGTPPFSWMPEEEVESCWLHPPQPRSVPAYMERCAPTSVRIGRRSASLRTGHGLPTVSNTVAELAQIYAGLVRDKDEDWIWEAMVGTLLGGFNRLDSTILRQRKTVIAGGADGPRRHGHRTSRLPQRTRHCENRPRLELPSHVVRRPRPAGHWASTFETPTAASAKRSSCRALCPNTTLTSSKPCRHGTSGTQTKTAGITSRT